MSVPLKAQTGWFGQLPINRWLERTTPSARAKVASRNFLGRAATPPLPRSIQSCPAGQLHNRKEVGGTKTKNLSAYFLERGVCSAQAFSKIKCVYFTTLHARAGRYRIAHVHARCSSSRSSRTFLRFSR